MPIQIQDLTDPAFLSLPLDEQRKGRQQLFDQFKSDPLFKQLPESEQQRLLKVDTASYFQKQQAAMGVKPEEAAAEVGGLAAPPPPTGSTAFNLVRGAANALALSDPIMAIPQLLMGAGAGTAPRAALAFGTFGAERAATEAYQRGEDARNIIKSAVGGGLREGAFGAALPFGTATSSTLVRGIVRPLAVGGGVGFLTAPSGERLQGALEGAATFGLMKGIGRGLGLAGRGVQAVRDLFSRGERTAADATPGLTDFVFGQRPGAAEALGLPAPQERLGLPPPIGSAEQSARAFEDAFAAEQALRQSERGGQLLRGQLAQQQSLEPGAQEFRPPPPLGGLPATVPPTVGPGGAGGLPPIQPPSVYVPGPPIRQGPPAVGALPPPLGREAGDLVSAISTRFGSELAEVPTAAEREVLQNLARDPTTAPELRQTARRVLRDFPEAQPPVTEPVTPPVTPVTEPAKPAEPTLTLQKIARRGPQQTASEKQAEVGDIVSATFQIAPKGVKFSGDIQGEKKSLIRQGIAKNFFNDKSGKPAGETAEELFKQGLLPEPTEVAYIDALRNRAATGKIAPPTVRQLDEGVMLAGIRAEPDGALLQHIINEPDSPVGKAAHAELQSRGFKFDVPQVVHIDDPRLDETVRGLLQGGQYGPGPTFTNEKIAAAETVAKKIRPNADPLDDLNKARENGAASAASGHEAPRFEQTAAGQQGMIPGTEGRNIPQGGLKAARGQTEAPTDLEKATLPPEESLLDPARVGPRGGAPATGGPGNSENNSLSEDIPGYLKRIFGSFVNTELSNLATWLTKRTMAMQELVRKFPELKPIYDAFHAYPAKATANWAEVGMPLYEKRGPLGEKLPTYFGLPDAQRQAIDELAMQHKVNRQGQPRMTERQMRETRGFTADMATIFNDVLDYGQNILKAHRDWYVERGIPALVRAGESEQAARATLEAQAAKALQGLDHWVPSYRRGDKIAVALDPNTGKTLDYRLEPNIRSRVQAVEDMKQKYPGAIIKEDVVDNFVRSKAFDEIDLGSLEVLSRFARVDPTIAQEFVDAIRPALLQRGDALAHFKKFENIPGFKKDLREGLIQTGKSAFNYIERQKAKSAASEALGQIDQRDQRELFRFGQQYIDDNMKGGDKALQKIRDLTYSYALGFNPKQWAVQFTQIPTVVFPEMLEHGTVGQATNAINTGMKYSFGKDLKTAPEELKNFWREAFKQRVIQPRAEMFSPESGFNIPSFAKLEIDSPQYRFENAMGRQLRSFETKGVNTLKNIRDLSMAFVSDMDMRTRFTAATGFYDLARKVKGMDIPTATQWAIDQANRTNYLYGRAESPQLFGRTGAGSLLNMFKSWPASYLSFVRGKYAEANQQAIAAGASSLGQRLGAMGKAAAAGPSPARALATSFGAMLALGGTLYNIPEPLRRAIGAGLGVDPETAMREVMTNAGLPNEATEVALRGLPALLGVDLARSIAIGDTVPSDLAGAIGPTPGAITALGTGAVKLGQYATQDFGPDPMDTLEAMLGGGAKNALKFARMSTEGLATRAGGKLPGTEQLREIDPALQLMGFTPLAVSKTQALQRQTQVELQAHRDQQANMMERYARAIVAQDEEAVKGINERIQAINEKAIANNRPDLLIDVSRAQLRQKVAEMLAPGAALKRAPKNARQRLLELQEIYMGPPEAPP